MKGPIKTDLINRFARFRQVNFVDWFVGVVDQHIVSGSSERAAFRENIHIDINGSYFRLWQPFILLVAALVLRLNFAAILGGTEFISDMGVVEEPGAGRERKHYKQGRECGQVGKSLAKQFDSYGPGCLCPAASQQNRQHSQQTSDK